MIESNKASEIDAVTNTEVTQSTFDSVSFLKHLTQSPGIYKMLDAQGEIIYIGKAKNLKNRVASYFRNPQASPKQQAMVGKIAAIEVTVTHTEGEALLLESQQIKHHKPRYNICLRDDKSYPYIYISSNHAFPQITFHRGAKKKSGKYYGPYPSANAVRESLKLLQKMFLVRQCDDSYYSHRSRPCLQHQIGRCKAPCVGLVDPISYAQDLADTQLFLEGKGNQLIEQRIEKIPCDTGMIIRLPNGDVGRGRVPLPHREFATEVAGLLTIEDPPVLLLGKN